MIDVRFIYSTGIRREIFRNVKLVGSWDIQGRYAEDWQAPALSMELAILEDGCPSYIAHVQFDSSCINIVFKWGIRLDAPYRPDIWGIPTEINDPFSNQRHCSFILTTKGGEQRYYLTHCRRLGAQKRFFSGQTNPAIQFSVWAPYAVEVETVIGKYDFSLQDQNTGYISENGEGIDSNRGILAMHKDSQGIWYTDMQDPQLANFQEWDHKLYMFRIKKDDGQTLTYRTDLYSRCQIGKGKQDPKGQSYAGSYKDLDGTKSCSVVVDPDSVTQNFEEPDWPETTFIAEQEFWAHEFDNSRPLPVRLEELIIYELHVGSLGYNYPQRDGNFFDVMGFLDYLVDLNINAIELLPVLEFEGVNRWGYGTSHPFALEFSNGGRDQLKHLVRACHQRGLAVIMDVVYNHYHVDAERAEWAYDSNDPQRNIYYWYEGHPSDYPAYEAAAKADPVKTPPGHGGYLDNYSTGYAPRFSEEMVRKWFISSAVALAEEFHIDGFRVDLTQAIYQFNVRHADGFSVDAANAFGAKFLREWTRTLKMVKPQCFLIAEDHSDQAFVTQSTEFNGLGFEATWYSAFYHHLIGDGNYGSDYARLLFVTGFGTNISLAMDYFAGALGWTGHGKIVYQKDHDNAANAPNTARNMLIAVNYAPLEGVTRFFAESRCRCISGLTFLSAGTPMFLMGEEIASVNPLPFENFRIFRDDFFNDRNGSGAKMFKFYQDIIRLRRSHTALQSRDIKIIYTNNENRIVAFLRRDGSSRFLIIASLNNFPFSGFGYWFPTPHLGHMDWQEVFNSDGGIYGGQDIGNFGSRITSSVAGIQAVIPANGFVVFQSLF